MSPTSSDPSESPEYLSLAKDDQHAAGMAVYRDDAFYFDLVTFKAENCLFRVPKHELEQQSTAFRDMFALPSNDGGENIEGTSDNNPIHLHGAKKDAFKLLLKLLYPPQSKDISSTLTFEQCASLFDLSRMWDFERILLIVKNRIRDVLWNDIACADKIKFAHDYEIKEWYADAYCELATRREPLSIEDGRKLGLEFSIKMGQVRERIAWDRTSRKEVVAQMAIDEMFFGKEHPEPQPAKFKFREEEETVDDEEHAQSEPGNRDWGGNTFQFSARPPRPKSNSRGTANGGWGLF